MSLKILLDVGAHIGQTARAACDSRFGFDRIVCFEPAESCWSEILSIGDPRIELCRFGLWNQTCDRTLHRAGFLGASIFADMQNLAQSEAPPVSIHLVRASEWFAQNVPADAVVFLKLNCEGAECDLLDDLMDSGELKKVYNLMIDFDVRYVPSLRDRETQIRRRLKSLGYRNAVYSDDVMKGPTHEDRIHHWLTLVGATDRLQRRELEMKYGALLARLSSATGRRARLRLAIRREVIDRLPAPIRTQLLASWHRIRAVLR